MELTTEFFLSADLGILLLLFVLGVLAFILSTISGGGGALVLVPALNALLGVSQTAPILNVGTLLGRPSRLILFWKYIHWKLCFYYIPAAIAGAWLGAWAFSSLKVEWLQIAVGVFLISTLWQYKFGQKERSFKVNLWFFIPLGVVVSVLGTIIGALGPVLNPFYLNYGLDREKLVATKTANSFLMGVSQIGSYTFFGLLSREMWMYGIALGLGATVGNIIGKRFLSNMKGSTFRKWVISLMVISGLVMIFSQIQKIF
ncbi:MAG: TSUP family transporter [Bacteroidetes bacterium]|nr:TSUP family transporter [Bacteroidota bacterium]